MQYAVAEPDPRHAGARWQVPEHLLQRRDRRRRRLLGQGARGLHDVRAESGRGLHLPVARLIQARHLRRVPGARGDPHQGRRQGNPLDTDTMIGSQASNDQLEKVLSYIEIGKEEGARVVAGGERAHSAATSTAVTTSSRRSSRATTDADLPGGDLRARRPVTSFKDYDDAIGIANDTLYGLGAGCGAATATWPTAPDATSRRGGSGRTAITLTRRTRRSAATSSPASAGRTTR